MAQAFYDFLQVAEEVAPKTIVFMGLQEALEKMESMPVNEGQLSAYHKYVPEPFKEQTTEILLGTNYQWEDIDIGEYMSFIGIIVEEGNQIMQEACDEATAMEEAIEAEEAVIYLLTRGRVGSFGDVVTDAFD